MRARVKEVIFSLCNQKMRKWEFLKLFRILLDTQTLSVRENSENQTFEISIWVKNAC